MDYSVHPSAIVDEGCKIGKGTKIWHFSHIMDQYSKTNVGKGASIGANATIVCGHDIGAYAFIGAGAVVTKNISPFALVVGNPARQIGWISEYGHRLEFNAAGEAFCPESRQKYILQNGSVRRVE